MTNETLSKTGKTKSHSPNSGITQKPATYRIDLDLVERLNQVKPNKNVFINAAIREKLDREYPAVENDDPDIGTFLQRYDNLKAKHPDRLLLFRCGNFYEAYRSDAEKASKVLGTTLSLNTSIKEPGGLSMKMTSFPYYALDTYLPKLIRANIRVAICDQIIAPIVYNTAESHVTKQ